MDEMQKSGSLGPIFATIIIVLVVLAGGVYFLIKQQQRSNELKFQNEQAQLPANS
jgi:preprotein translocase subunit YajC